MERILVKHQNQGQHIEMGRRTRLNQPVRLSNVLLTSLQSQLGVSLPCFLKLIAALQARTSFDIIRQGCCQPKSSPHYSSLWGGASTHKMGPLRIQGTGLGKNVVAKRTQRPGSRGRVLRRVEEQTPIGCLEIWTEATMALLRANGPVCKRGKPCPGPLTEPI